MVHSTGANNPNLRRYVQPDDGVLGVNSNQNDWNRPGLEVCVHAFLGLTQAGEVAAYQILPGSTGPGTAAGTPTTPTCLLKSAKTIFGTGPTGKRPTAWPGS